MQWHGKDKYFDREFYDWELTWVMFGAKTMAILRAFILLICSCSTTSAIRLMAQSKRAASVGGRCLTSSAHSSSIWHCITRSGDKESRMPLGSSRNQAFQYTRIKKSRISSQVIIYYAKWECNLHRSTQCTSPACLDRHKKHIVSCKLQAHKLDFLARTLCHFTNKMVLSLLFTSV